MGAPGLLRPALLPFAPLEPDTGAILLMTSEGAALAGS